MTQRPASARAAKDRLPGRRPTTSSQLASDQVRLRPHPSSHQGRAVCRDYGRSSTGRGVRYRRPPRANATRTARAHAELCVADIVDRPFPGSPTLDPERTRPSTSSSASSATPTSARPASTQGIDTEEIIAAVHARRAPMMSATAALRL
jgi:hypothetical protein